MSKDWEYAKLSRIAKQAGGPKQLLAKVFQQGYEQGIRESAVNIINRLLKGTRKHK